MGGIAESPRENCKLKTLDFLKSKVKVTLQNSEVLWAFRSGKKATNVAVPRPRQIIARVTLDLKERVMKNAKNLKGLSDPDSQVKCFVSVNEPEAYKAAQKKYKSMMDSIRVANATRTAGQKIRARLVGKRFLVNNKPFVEVIHPPTPMEVLRAVEQQEDWLDKLTFVESAIHRIQGNVFKGYAIRLSKLQSVHLAYCKLRGLFPSRDHIMMAYAIPSATGSCDDGEYFGDLQIADSIRAQSRDHLAIFIARSSGKKLGMKRFDIIKMITQELFTALDDPDNQDVVDGDIPEWEYVQTSLQDILRLPTATSVQAGDSLSDASDHEIQMDVEIEVAAAE